MTQEPTQGERDEGRRGQEAKLFLFLVIFLFPILAVAIVGGYGFAVWMLDLLITPTGMTG